MGDLLLVLGGFVVLDLTLFFAVDMSARRCLAGFIAFGLPLLVLVGLARAVARAFEGRDS